ncbi:MAG: hypothetical protein IKM58_01015 [Tidjanibacter sp.]|nr:hypothetical protein [Tidjanibacter sp.]
MNKKALCAICVLMMFSCGVVQKQESTPVVTEAAPDELYSNDSLRSIFHYTEGLKSLLVNSNPEKAIKEFDKSIEMDSTSAATYFQMAAAVAPKSPDSALMWSRKSVALDSLEITYRHQLGQLLIMNQRFKEATKLYEKMLVEDPRNPNNYRMLAALYEYNGQPFAAIAMLDSAEYKVGRLPELAEFKKELLIGVKHYDRAIKETLTQLEENPYDINNYTTLAQLYGMTGKDSLAVVNFQKAMKIDSTDMRNLALQLDFYHQRNRNQEYLSIMRKIFEADNIPVDSKVKLFKDITASRGYYQDNYFSINALAGILLAKYPSNSDIVELYTTHLIRSGELERALEVYKNHIGAGHQELKAYYGIMDIESYLQRTDSVEKYAEKALELFPDDSELYLRKGFAEQSMAKFKEALDTYNEGLKHASTDSVKSVILTTIGDTYHTMGKTKKCFAYYDKALELDGNNAALLNNYAYFLCESGVVNEEVLAMGKKACELVPNNSTYLDTWGWILFKMGRLEEAKKIMQQAISFDSSKSSDLAAHYGDILHATGNNFLAEFYWKQALENGYNEEEIRKRLEKIGAK